MTLAGGGSGGSTRPMPGANRSQRFKLSLPFLNRKKKSKDLLEGEEGEEDESVHVLASGVAARKSNATEKSVLGDILQDIAEENEEQLHENAIVLDQLISGGKSNHHYVDQYLQQHHHGGVPNEAQNLTVEYVPKIAFPFDLQPSDAASLSKGQMTYKSFEIPFPHGGSPPSRRRTERSSSMKARDASTRSGSMRTESTSTQMTAGGNSKGGRGWLSTGCGFRSCSKQIDMEAKLRSKDRAAHGEKQRSQRSRSKSADVGAWETDTVSEWSVLAAVEKDQLARKRAPGPVAAAKKKRGHKKSSRLAPSPGISPSDAAALGHSESKISMREAYVEVREAAKYDLPSQRSDPRRGAEGGKDGSQNTSESSSEDDNTGDEERDNRHLHPWERSINSPTSDEEIFTTSFELDGKTRKKWSSNSSDEVERRHRRSAAAAGDGGGAGSHGRSKSSWSSHSVKGGGGGGGQVVHEEEEEDDDELDDVDHESGKKGSRIIFLSTPPRPEDLGMDEDEPSTNDQILLKSTSDRFGEHSKLEPGIQVPRFERTLSMGYNNNKANSAHSAASFTNEAADMEANAKAWSKKLDVVRSNLRNNARTAEDSTVSDASVRELPMMSKSKESGKQRRYRHIDVQVEDQLVNLRLESDVSDSSQGKTTAAAAALASPARAYGGSRSSSKMISSNGKGFDVLEKPTKKKKGLHGRRRRARKARAPPPLPNDLHGKVKESVAVVKSSYDPYADFRDSMVEMIVEKEIQGATDLEELLRCYLSLNAAEYHAVIVKVFADVWRELFADTV